MLSQSLTPSNRATVETPKRLVFAGGLLAGLSSTVAGGNLAAYDASTALRVQHTAVQESRWASCTTAFATALLLIYDYFTAALLILYYYFTSVGVGHSNSRQRCLRVKQ